MRERELQFVVGELTHRTKNQLAVVQAIANSSGRNCQTVKEFLTSFSMRLQCLSRSIDAVSKEDGHVASINDLVRCQLEPFGAIDGTRLVVTGPPLHLTPDAAQNIGLALHELATNAVKHGSLSVPEGAVTINWELGPGELAMAIFRMTWRERNGPPVFAPKRRGFGEAVLQRITGQTFQGKTTHEFAPTGVIWTLEVPAAAITTWASGPVA